LDMNNYFIAQVGASATALGVSSDDVTAIANALNSTFNTRCPPVLTESDGVPAFLVGTNPSICTDASCPLAVNATCTDAAPTSAPVSVTTPAPILAPTPAPISDQTICMKYTTALFTNDTADNELALIAAVVNLAVLGNATLNVDGILAADGGLLSFFSGASGNTTNRGGTPVTVNFLDGAADLPNPSMSSNTYILLLHLYQFFGALLGCTAAGFPEYSGMADMYSVHKFMGITLDMNNYFISQVGAAASALGVTDEDVTAIANALNVTFNTRCPPALTESDAVPAFLVGTNPSICTDASCPLAVNATCTDNVTLCGKYTSALFGDDTAENELTLIMAVVNLAVLGNQSLNVPGILADNAGLKPIFNGAAGPTTNRGGTAVQINFIDGGTNTATLLNHLYQFFGALLGCSAAGFPAYQGVPDMFSVHKFMRITLEQNDYFISQVGAAALALGVTKDDVQVVANVLDGLFNTRCPPAVAASTGAPDFLVGTNPSICQDSSCPLDMNAVNTTCMQVTTPVKAPVSAPTSGASGVRFGSVGVSAAAVLVMAMSWWM
jgi:hypothetical protein